MNIKTKWARSLLSVLYSQTKIWQGNIFWITLTIGSLKRLRSAPGKALGHMTVSRLYLTLEQVINKLIILELVSQIIMG
jgi:hypothetical protein